VDNGIDDEASAELKALDPEMQHEVFSRGPLSDVRNPSAVILSRIRQVKRGLGKMSDGGYAAERADLNREIDEFVKDNNLDERADTCLRETEEEVLRELFLAPLHDARNPSAVVLTRIRNIKAEQCDRRRMGVVGPYTGWASKGHDYAPPPPPRVTTNRKELDEKIEKFIVDNELDERASSCLRESDEYVLRGLFSRGSLTHARNPSALALFRIKQTKEDLGAKSRERSRSPRRGESGGKGKGKGDWWDWMNDSWNWWAGKGSWGSPWGGKGGMGKGAGKGPGKY